MVTPPDDDSSESLPPDTVPTIAIGPGAIEARPDCERRMTAELDVEPDDDDDERVAPLGERRTGDDVVPVVRRVTVRVRSGSKPCSIIRAKASAEIASSEPPVLDDRRMDAEPFVLDERRTLTDRDAERPGLFDRAEAVPAEVPRAAVPPTAVLRDAASNVDDPLVVEFAPLLIVSRLGGNTMGATGRSSITDRRMAAGRGAVAAR